MKVLLATTATPDDRKTVACARSLAGAGASVTVGGDEFWGQAFYTRSVRRRIRYPHPCQGIPPFIDAINDHSKRQGFDVVLPMNDYTTVALTQGRDRLDSSIATALPPPEAQEIANDKVHTVELANSLGIETPATVEIAAAEPVQEIAEQIGFPCVIKLRRGSGAVGYQRVEDLEQLSAALEQERGPSDLGFDREHLLVQEYVPGVVHDACVLCDRGEIVAAFNHKRLHTYPPEAGIGTLFETTHEPDLLNRARRVFKALHWHGPGQVEFKVDPETGRTWLIEINGRFWGATGVAIRAGVDFPLLTCKLAVGEEIDPCREYEVGLRYRYPFPFGLLAIADGGSSWQAVRDLLMPRRDTCSDLLWSDPLPFLAESLFIARRAWQRRSLRPVEKRL